MLYDLNIAWSPGTPAAELERTLKFAKNLGYDVVALNHIITTPIPTQPNPITNPIPLLTPPHPSYPGGSSASTTTPTTSITTTTNVSTTAPSTLPPSSKSSSSLPTTLRRATLTITDPSTTNYRLPDYARAYDLVALRPTSDKSFQWACLATAEPPALVSLDLSAHLGWHVHHRTAMAAVQRGTRFEVCYSQAFGTGSGTSGVGDVEAARQRANFIGNVQMLVRATKGRGIVLSSEARGALGLRAPADVVNLMAVWGLGPEKGFAGFGEGARAVVVNEGIKRRGFRGVVDIVKPAEGGEAARKGEAEVEEGVKTKGKKQKQQQQQQQGQGQKRKNGEAGSGGGGGGGGNASGQPVEMSKRQAKKMKKEGTQAKS
ncbi:RNase P subunit p30-domain-containing protein [Staphylotrichum tortipilum]|uniref:RNase P subunit p30-domain-containing protein n=1 Tax=Staphylotrichum tortipilum TaxID=2831512 RepID=A0AAN6MPK7_9PEZI|nr:RNase P subunit p30-domain-containing protein [Staphylotrichum longicolle]